MRRVFAAFINNHPPIYIYVYYNRIFSLCQCFFVLDNNFLVYEQKKIVKNAGSKNSHKDSLPKQVPSSVWQGIFEFILVQIWRRERFFFAAGMGKLSFGPVSVCYLPGKREFRNRNWFLKKWGISQFLPCQANSGGCAKQGKRRCSNEHPLQCVEHGSSNRGFRIAVIPAQVRTV